jgi:hypothetical protein
LVLGLWSDPDLGLGGGAEGVGTDEPAG